VTITNERAAARVMLLPNCIAVPNPAVREPEKAFPVAALLVAAAPIIADFVYGAVKGYLERSKQDLTANYTASGSGTMYGRDELLANHCLVIARGRFGPPSGIGNDDTQGALKGSHLAPLGLADFPDLYFEAWLTQDTRRDGSRSVPLSSGRVTVAPQLIQFADTAAKNEGSGTKFIGILLAITETAADPKEGKEKVKSAALATLPFEFGEMKEGTAVKALAGQENSPLNPLADQHRAIVLQRDDQTAPTDTLNLYAFITETEDPNPWHELVLATITGQEETIEGIIKKVIEDTFKEEESKEGA
jgi:hypothetical protein